MTICQFTVLGLPQPQGSKRLVRPGVMIESADVRPWRQAVAHEARRAAAVLEDAPLDRPLCLAVQFRFAVPKVRRKAAVAAGGLWKVTAPDTDKLARAVGDALTDSGLIVDDSRLALVLASKVEVEGWTGATITLYDLDAPPAVAA